MTTSYQIKIKGQLDPSLSAWFGDLAISYTPENDTLLTGSIIDQAALHGILARCRDAGVTLISINPINEQTTESTGEQRNSMNTFNITATKIIDARPEDVYGVFSDYVVAHNAILPRPFFTGMDVKKGGRGAGTEILVYTKALGQERHMFMVVSEPTPGRDLMETEPATGLVTHFIVEALNGGRQAKVTISTDFPIPAGFGGWLQKTIQAPLIRPVYLKELDNVAEYLRAKQPVLAMG
jgi:hypothetical protein